MRKVIIAATIAGLVLAAPAARADEWGGLVGGLAGGLIAGAIASSMQPHTVYVPVERRHHVAPRPRAPAPTRVVVVHDRLAPVAVPVPVPVAAPAPAPANNNNIVVAPAPAPTIVNAAPGSLGSDSDSGSVPAGLREDHGLPRLPEGCGCEVKRPKRESYRPRVAA